MHCQTYVLQKNGQPHRWSLRKKGSAIAVIIANLWKTLSSDRSDNDLWDRKSFISAIVVAAIAGEWFPYDRYDRCDRWTFFFSAIEAIIWKPGFTPQK